MAKLPLILSILSLFQTGAYADYGVKYSVNSRSADQKIGLRGDACWDSKGNETHFYGKLEFEKIIFSMGVIRVPIRKSLEFNVYSDDSIFVQGKDTLRLADYPGCKDVLKIIQTELKEKNPENSYKLVVQYNSQDSTQNDLIIKTFYDKDASTLRLKSKKRFLFGLKDVEIKASCSPDREDIPATIEGEYRYKGNKIPITFSFNGYSSEK